MVDPINYGALLTQIDLSGLQRGLQSRQLNRQQEAVMHRQDRTLQLAEAKFTAEQENDKAFQTWMTDFAADPTSQRLLEGTARFPDHAKALSDGFQAYTGAQQQDIIKTTVSALGAIGAGKPEVAAEEIGKRKTALAKAGVNTDQTDAAFQLINSGDPAKVRQGTAYLAVVLTGAIGRDDAAKIMDQFGLGPKADAAAAKEERDERRLEQADRRIANSERATNAAIAGRNRDDARADRKAAGGGKKGKGGYSNADLDALLQ